MTTAPAVASSDGLGCVQCKEWEGEIDSLYKALHVKLDETTVDIACSQALEAIACLKHIAIEMAAHGDCHCTKKDDHCPYCIACNLVDSGLRMTEDDERRMIDALDALAS